MRYKLSQNSLAVLFNELDKLGFTINDMAVRIGVNPRTLRDLKRGKFTIPKDKFDTLVKLARINIGSLDVDTLQEWWNNKQAGKIGGSTYNKT